MRNTIDVVAEDCAGWEDKVRIQVVYVIPGAHDPRTKGFWMEALKTRKYSLDEMNTLISYVNVASDVWGHDATRNRYGPLNYLKAYQVLRIEDNSEMEQKMQGQLLADWLNMVSGRVAVKAVVDVSKVARYELVMDDIGGDPITFAYKVALEIEEKAQPAPPEHAVNLVAKNLAEGINMNQLFVP